MEQEVKTYPDGGHYMRHGNRLECLVNMNRLTELFEAILQASCPPNVITAKLLNRNEAAPWLSRSLLAALLITARCVFADSYWHGSTSGFNVAGSWNPAGVPTGINAINDSGSNNVVLIRPGDPVWRPWDIRAGDGVNASGSYLQTG